MWLPIAPRVDLPLPVWTSGYRCHGYWLDGQRVGHVGLTPPGHKPVVYSWGIDAAMATASGECAALRTAKRHVEAAFRRLYSWRFPGSR